MRNNFQIIPKPGRILPTEGRFEITSGTTILADPANLKNAHHLIALLSIPEDRIVIDESSPAKDDSIVLRINPALDHLSKEGYQLEIKPEHIIISAGTETGVFYGIQTLRQLIPPESLDGAWLIPCMQIEDQPRFSWRGLMLDTARHMFKPDEIKRLLDQMALHKFNRFHWHLTDDQGWRIEIRKYPRLTEIGSRRTSTPIPARPRRSDETPYGGYYTQAEIHDIVQYAAERHITVVPEIDMPGHSIAALAAYPELGCTGGPYEVRTSWGVEYDVYCAGNEKVHDFLEDVLDEILELFPSEVIHIGGDEVPKDRWKECPKCQAKISSAGLTDEDELQSYFIRRMGEYLLNKGRRFIGWDEIIEGGLAPGAMVMAWRGMQGGITAANAGHDVVMSPITNCYLDYRQHENKKLEPPAIRSVLLLEDANNFEPVPPEIETRKQKHILGIQGNLWTEYIPTFEHLQYMAWPRGCALAEVAWSGPERDYENFLRRLQPHLARLKRLGIQFRDPFNSFGKTSGNQTP